MSKEAWKPRLYIGTSIFDGLISNLPSAKDCTIQLFEKCKDRIEYEGLISPFTIFELQKRYDEPTMQKVINWALEYNLNLISFHSFKEVDFLVEKYANNNILPKELEWEYYHVASCTYLNIDFYVSWNTEDIINYSTFNKFFHQHLSTGYRSAIKLRTPEFLVGKTCTDYLHLVLEKTFPSKASALEEIQLDTIPEKTKYVQTIVGQSLKNRIPIIELPNKRFRPSRQPLLKLDEVELKFQVKSYEKEIEQKEIPLLGDIETGFYSLFHLFHLQTLEGEELLKNKLIEIFSHYPVNLSGSEHVKYANKKSTHFLNWLLPRIRGFIEKPLATFPKIEESAVKRNYYKEIDEQFHRSIDYNDIKLAKEKAIELTEFITKGQWAKFHPFTVHAQWCDINNFDDNSDIFHNDTHIIADSEGKEIWIVMMISHIP